MARFAATSLINHISVCCPRQRCHVRSVTGRRHCRWWPGKKKRNPTGVLPMSQREAAILIFCVQASSVHRFRSSHRHKGNMLMAWAAGQQGHVRHPQQIHVATQAPGKDGPHQDWKSSFRNRGQGRWTSPETASHFRLELPRPSTS